ncbi:hypothetical protein ACWF62_15330 [Rhodococcus sp. NPDC054953]
MFSAKGREYSPPDREILANFPHPNQGLGNSGPVSGLAFGVPRRGAEFIIEAVSDAIKCPKCLRSDGAPGLGRVGDGREERVPDALVEDEDSRRHQRGTVAAGVGIWLCLVVGARGQLVYEGVEDSGRRRRGRVVLHGARPSVSLTFPDEFAGVCRSVPLFGAPFLQGLSGFS